jgi:hypothetical protein
MTRMNNELTRLLDEQAGVVTSAQALTYLTRRGLEAELNRGGLQKIWYGIYGQGEVITALQLRGLDLATGTTVAVCLGTAASASGFDTEETRDRRRAAALQDLDWVAVPMVAEDVRYRQWELLRRIEGQLERAPAA